MDLDQKNRLKASAFTIIILTLCSIILLQLYIFGLGILKQLKAEPEVKIIEKEVTKFVTVSPKEKPAPPSSPQPPKPIPELTPLEFTSQRVVADIASNQRFEFTPKIKSASIRELLSDAKRARTVGDLRLMAVNLEEAYKEDPKNPHTNFLFGDMHEAMGLYDKASSYYETVMGLGLSKAGELYRTASEKLKQGVDTKQNTESDLIIGSVNQFRDPRIQSGESIKITIPILSSPNRVIDPSQVTVSVRIYDKQGTDIIPCLPENKATCKWKDDSVNWVNNGEETLIADYFLPNSDSQPSRSYYGFIIELTYGGRLIDQFCYPRILLNEITQNMGFGTIDFDLDPSDMNLNYSNLLLPPLE